MVHHSCYNCQIGFIAISYEEAVEERGGTEEGDEDAEGKLEYARYCPYCGGRGVEVG